MDKENLMKENPELTDIIEKHGWIPTILIAEDDPEMLDIIETIFTRLTNYSVTTAWNGVEAMTLLEKESAVDLIIVDDNMHEMAGHEMTREVRKLPDYSDVPIVMTGGAGGRESEESFYSESKGSAYVYKPYELLPFMNLVNACLLNHFKLQTAKKENQHAVISGLMAEREQWRTY